MDDSNPHIFLDIDLSLKTTLDQNGPVPNPEIEKSQLNEILIDDANMNQIHQALKELAQNLKLKIKSQLIQIFIDEYSNSTDLSFFIDLYPQNTHQFQNLNNYFNNETLYDDLPIKKTQTHIQTLLTLKDLQTKLPEGSPLIDNWWSTMQNYPSK